MSSATTPSGHVLTAPVARLSVLLGTHVAVDVYSAIVPSILGLLEVRCDLSPEHAAWVLGIAALSSGVAQPSCAWLSDRFDSRIFGAIGLGLAAICLASIGAASSLGSLLPLLIIGTFGVGMYHPVGASSVGAIADRLRTPRRSAGVSAFFVAGMVGGMTGALMAPRVVALPGGFRILAFLMIPGLLAAVALQFAIGRVPHRTTTRTRSERAAPGAWPRIACLYVASALRFLVNTALLFLFVRWAATVVPEGDARAVAEAAAPIVGNLNALTVLGMAIGGIASGVLVRAGREGLPLVVVPIVFAPAILMLPRAGLGTAYVLAVVAGIGFASMIPVSIALAQRLLPHRTSLASGLMMGGAWAVGMFGPRLAAWGVADDGLDLGIDGTFSLIAGLLVVSGLAAIPLWAPIFRPKGR